MDDRDFIRRQPCAACKAPQPSDPAHIKSRGAGGKNEDWELMPLCRPCHIMQHKVGWKKMAEMFPGVLDELDIKGWSYDAIHKKWLNDNKRGAK